MAEIVKKKIIEQSQETPNQLNNSIIESEVFDASRKARSIIAQAEEKAAQIQVSAEDEAGKVIQESREKGCSEGRNEGFQSYQEAILNINKEYDHLLSEAQDQLLKMSMGIAHKVISCEIKTNPQAIVSLVKKSIEPLNRKRSITLRINPSDRKVLEDHHGQLLESMLHGGTIHFVNDEGISRGGCIIETEHGTVDAQLETQLGIINRMINGTETIEEIQFEIEECDPVEVVTEEVSNETEVDQTPQFDPIDSVDPIVPIVQEEQSFVAPEIETTPESFEVLKDPQEPAIIPQNLSKQVEERVPEKQDKPLNEEVRKEFLNEIDQITKDLESSDINDLLENLDEYLKESEESEESGEESNGT